MPVAGTVISSTAPRQLTDDRPEGTQLGQLAAELIGFWGGGPVSQAANSAQSALVRGQAFGSIGTFGTTQSPTGVANSAVTETGFTLAAATATYQINSTDLLYVNKPAQQAGLGVGNIRYSAANIAAVSFNNFTGATITPTASEKYGIVALRGIPYLTQTLTPASVPAQTIVEQQFTVPGIRVGGLIQGMKPTSQAGLDIVGWRAVAANTLGITYANLQATTPITPTAETYTVWTLNALDGADNLVMVEKTLTPAFATLSTAGAQAFTVTGMALTDALVGVQKPTQQAGLGIMNGSVTAANTVSINFGNFTAATITPTAGEAYSITFRRPNPAAPMKFYNVTLTPAAVASNTTAEQSFTVTGLVANSIAWVNKPSFTAGIGIAGVRVSATNTLYINYANNTSGAITPPAETYIVGNFQQPVPDGATTWVYAVSPAQQQVTLLSSAIREALVASGFIAGS